MHPTFKTIYAVFILFLFACNLSEKQESATAILEKLNGKTWYISDYKPKNPAPSSNIEEKLVNEMVNVSRVKQGMFFQIFQDKTIAFIEGNEYYSGTWEFDENSKMIVGKTTFNDKRKTIKLKVKAVDQNRMTAEIAEIAENDAEATIKCEYDNYVYAAPDNSPWHPVNNRWRIKADTAESYPKLLARFKNHVQHYITLLQAMVDNKGNTLSVLNSPSCIQIYNGGIGIRNAENIDKEWYDTFYSKEDAEKCLGIFETVVTRYPYHGQSSGKWTEDDLLVLKSLYAGLLEMEKSGSVQ